MLPELDAQPFGLVGGGAIVNTDDDRAEWHGLAWRVEGEQVVMGISSSQGRTDDGTSMWQLESVWMLQLGPDSKVTIGNDVCKAQAPTHDYGSSLFFAVTNDEQDTALGAWIITIEGPVAYEAFADLECEKFFP